MAWLEARLAEIAEEAKSWPDWVFEQPLNSRDAEKIARGERLRRRAPMANEDVLERARNFDRELSEADKQRRMVDLGALHLIHALAAALREAMEDTRRLDFLSEPTAILTVFDSGAYGSFGGRFIAADGTLRGLIDAEMKPPGGEGSGHE